MAADVYGVLSSTDLPYGWDSAVTSDGRVFFINDYERITTWLSPVTGEPVQSGHVTSLGLPRGWELGYTPDGVKYYIDHNQRLTAFTNPTTGKPEAIKTSSFRPTDHDAYSPQRTHSSEQTNSNPRPISEHNTFPSTSSADPGLNITQSSDLQDEYVEVHTNSPQQVVTTLSRGRQQGRQGYALNAAEQTDEGRQGYPHNSTEQTNASDDQRLSPYKATRLDSPANAKFLTNSPTASKSKSFLDRFHAVKKQTPTKKMNGPKVRTRSLDVPVSMKGCLHKLESNPAGVRKWKRRFFVLQDFCLYTYKDSKENEILDSIVLPSYTISMDTKYNKEFGFKAEHENMKTHYFAADHEDSLNNWVAALRMAANVQRDTFFGQDFNRTDGDGTDSPNIASPFHDQRVKERFGPAHQYYSHRHGSPASRSPSGLRPHSLNASRSSDVRSPDRVDRGWAPSDPAPQYDGDWQAHGVSVRGEPRTPPSVVNPPWKRENPHTPTYRPPHYENLPTADSSSPHKHRHSGPPRDGAVSGGETPPPPRPQKLAPRGSAGPPLAIHNQPNTQRDLQHVRQPANYPAVTAEEQKRRDQLQAKSNLMKRLNDPLIFQFPAPYRPPSLLQGNRGGHQPINFNKGYPPAMSRNNNNNIRPHYSHDATFVNNSGQPVFKPPTKVVTHGRLTANDLVGKSQEELVLLLIELRREQSQLESSIDVASQRLGHAKIELDRLQHRREDSFSIRRDMEGLSDYIRSTEKQIEIQRPLIHLVDNMVKMSSMYGNQNSDLAGRQGRNVESDKRKMEFSRRLEEQQISREHKAEGQRRLGIDSSSLDMKLEELYRSDQDIHKHSEFINRLRHRMKKVEDDLINVMNLLENKNYPLYIANQMLEDKHSMEFDLSQIRKQLSIESQKMEILTSQNSKLQEDLMSMKSQLAGRIDRGRSMPSLNGDTTNHLHNDVQRTQVLVDGLQMKNHAISEAMSSLKFHHESSSVDSQSIVDSAGTYFETDIDTMTTRDLSLKQHGGSRQPSNNTIQVTSGAVHRPKAMTMRDMKRASASRIEHQRDADRVDGWKPREQGYHQTPPSKSYQAMPPQTHGSPQFVRRAAPQKQQQRPVSAYEQRSSDLASSQPNQFSNRQSASERLFTSASSAGQPSNAQSLGEARQPPLVKPVAVRGKAQARRKENRARYMTISSSQPVQLEAANIQRGAPNSFNRPNFVSSSSALDRDFTQDVIDNQLLAPQKVHIPERYVPDSSDEEEVMTPAERQRRAEKAEQIRKMVASQSLQEFSRSEINAPDEAVAQKVKEEKKRRELVLEMRHAMAKEVTQKMQKMRSKSHENLSWPTGSC